MFMLPFADDTVLFANTLEELQMLLDNLHKYYCKWNISVNITKAKSMVFKSGNRLKTSIFNKYTKLSSHINQIIEHLYDNLLQGWFGELNNMSKLSKNKCFKIQFCVGHYFDCVTNEKHRIQLTRFRCSS